MTRATSELATARRKLLALLDERLGQAADAGFPHVEPRTSWVLWPRKAGAGTATRTLAHLHRDLARRRLIAHLMGDR